MSMVRPTTSLAFLDHLQDACDRAGVGFHFEEGGCYGMALALRQALEADGFETRYFVVDPDRLDHVYVEAAGHLHDYTGQVPMAEAERALSLPADVDLVAMVVGMGAREEDDLMADIDLASEIIEAARERSLVPSPGPS